MDYVRDKIIALPLNSEIRALPRHDLRRWNHPQTFFGQGILRTQNDRSCWAVPRNQFLRRADVDDLSVLDYRYAVAQPLGFFHQVSCEEHSLPTVADAPYQFPNCSP